MKKFIRTILAAAAVAMLASMPAWADTITNITVKAGYPDDDEMQEDTPVEPSFTITSGDCYLSDASEYSNSTSYKNAHSYNLEIYANGGSYFPTNSKEITVNAVGCTGVSRITVNDSNHITVRVTAYPYYKWPAPDYSEDFDPIDSKSLKIKKNGAPTVDYIIEYNNQKGEAKSATGSTTNSSISVSTYNKEYSGQSDYKQSAEITGIAIRVRGKAGENTNTAPSDWTIVTGEVDTNAYGFVEYESWSDIGSPTSYNNSSSSSTTTTNTGVTQGRWEGSGTTWRYIINGSYVYGSWIQDNGYWYYIGADGLMQVGLINLNNQIFYLNPNYDSTYGRMLTGWQTVNGAAHYFQETYNSTYGMMLQ